jgi:hypothetical protein
VGAPFVAPPSGSRETTRTQRAAALGARSGGRRAISPPEVDQAIRLYLGEHPARDACERPADFDASSRRAWTAASSSVELRPLPRPREAVRSERRVVGASATGAGEAVGVRGISNASNDRVGLDRTPRRSRMTFGPDGALYVANFGFGTPPGTGQILRLEVQP